MSIAGHRLMRHETHTVKSGTSDWLLFLLRLLPEAPCCQNFFQVRMQFVGLSQAAKGLKNTHFQSKVTRQEGHGSKKLLLDGIIGDVAPLGQVPSPRYVVDVSP